MNTFIAIVALSVLPLWQVGMADPWRPAHEIATDWRMESVAEVGYYYATYPDGEVAIIGSGAGEYDTLLFARNPREVAAWCAAHEEPSANWRETLRPKGICK